MRAVCLLMLVLSAVAAEAGDEPIEVTVTAQDVRAETDHHLVAAVVLDSDRPDLPATITLVYPQAPPAWTANALPARRLRVAKGATIGYRVVEDLGAVVLGADEPEPAPPVAPSVEELAAKGAALAMGEDVDAAPASPPAATWERRQRRVLVLAAGDTLLVHCPDGRLRTGGADLIAADGVAQLIMVVAADERFAVLSGCRATVGAELELVQEVRVGDGR